MASGHSQDPASNSSISSGSSDTDNPQPSSPSLVSPFKDSADKLCESSVARYSQPSQVNSYVKFRWFSRRRSSSVASLTQSLATLPQPPQPTVGASPASRPNTPDLASVSSSTSIDASTPLSPSRAIANESQPEAPFSLVPDSANAPSMLPPHFGLMAAMDARDRPLWDFCELNRSLLQTHMFLNPSPWVL